MRVDCFTSYGDARQHLLIVDFTGPAAVVGSDDLV